MVAASSTPSQRPSFAGTRRGPRKPATGKENGSHLPAPLNEDLPSVATCITHLKLLAAFSHLKQSVSSQDGLFGIHNHPNSNAAALKWTIFVATAVTRFEAWLRKLLPSSFEPSLARSTATNPSEMDKLMVETEAMTWTQDMMPPLDVLMVLHSYMLNPHDFLHDCLRCSGLSLWKAGFPWELVSASIDKTSLKYSPSESKVEAFRKRTGHEWSYMNPEHETSIKCSNCSNCIAVRWTELYSEEPSQMEKGNTFMPFTLTCPNCHSQMSQDFISKARLKADLGLLLTGDIVMPSTILSKDGLVPTACSEVPVNADTALLNSILCDGMADELIEKINKAQQNNGTFQLSSCAMNDTIISALTEGSTRDNAKGSDETEKTFSTLMKSAQRMRAVYDKNMSTFALDLVGAVIRQGVFIEKMQYFDWVHSPAVEHTVSCATERYANFFRVMQQNPGRTVVPTFDVDLIWHTQQLTPMSYYKYSVENCNRLFIDHDDKIVDDVLSNSFEWTCEQFSDLTGKNYDKCLCWCCAILEQDCLSPKRTDLSNHKLSFRIKAMLKSLKRYEEPSPAESQVFGIQLIKFEKDYTIACKSALEHNDKPLTKKRFFADYRWHYPAYAPHPEEVGAT